MGKDLSKRKSEVPFPKPKVDDYRMLSVTIVHEWMHTIYSEGVLQYEDQEYPNSYGWKNMVRMGRGSSLHNADSVAYVGE
jgi:hypothetical protein